MSIQYERLKAYRTEESAYVKQVSNCFEVSCKNPFKLKAFEGLTKERNQSVKRTWVYGFRKKHTNGKLDGENEPKK